MPRSVAEPDRPYINNEPAAQQLRLGFAPGEHCHAGRDGDCFWEACPQEMESRAHYLSLCPLAVDWEEGGGLLQVDLADFDHWRFGKPQIPPGRRGKSCRSPVIFFWSRVMPHPLGRSGSPREFARSSATRIGLDSASRFEVCTGCMALGPVWQTPWECRRLRFNRRQLVDDAVPGRWRRRPPSWQELLLSA